MDELYLIAHKVSSELAFDIAQRVVIGDDHPDIRAPRLSLALATAHGDPRREL
jgi:hypothetical protein